ncbi:MAG: hypothetical protein AAGJ70_04490 [Pseudomonadota bacterium]
MGPPVVYIPPAVTVVDDCDFLVKMPSDMLIAAWITAAPERPSIIGPLAVEDLARASPPAVFESVADLPLDVVRLVGSLEKKLPSALERSGFARVREDGFPDRVFLCHGAIGVAYESVHEHLAETCVDDFDAAHRLRNPILCARALTIVAARAAVSDLTERSPLMLALSRIETIVLEGNSIANAQFDYNSLPDPPSLVQETEQQEWLRDRWRRLVDADLPRAAPDRLWPISANHCFARVLLDGACGQPWREIITPPAWRNAPAEILTTAILTGERVLSGEDDLNALNLQSLRMRGKA